MWLALVLYCSTPDVTSCNVVANVDKLYITEESCLQDANSVATYLISQNLYASSGCLKIGESA